MKKRAYLRAYMGQLRGRRPLAVRRTEGFASIPISKRLIDRGKEKSTEMKRFLVAVIVGIVIVMALAACGGGSTDGGWLGHATGRVYFLQITNGTGEVDYAVNYNGQVERFHGGVVVHDDGTIEVDGMVDGPLKDCSACPYQLTNGNLVVLRPMHLGTSTNRSSISTTVLSGQATTIDLGRGATLIIPLGAMPPGTKVRATYGGEPLATGIR